jgi:tetratricopeptide (TPR) repeat protein
LQYAARILAVILILAFTMPAFAQASLWQTFYDEGMSSLNKSAYADAEKQLNAAMRAGSSLGDDDPRVVSTVKALARVHAALGRYDQAEVLYKKALVADERKKRSDDVITDLRNIAFVLRKQNKTQDAFDAYKRIDSILVKSPESQWLRAQAMSEHALLLQEQGAYKDAEQLLLNALTISEKVLKPNDPALATPLENIANLYALQGRFAEAEPLFKKALTLRESSGDQQDPKASSDLNKLATLYGEQGRFTEAETLFKRTLAMAEKQFGPQSAATVQSLDRLAHLYLDNERAPDAVPLLQRAAEIREKLYGAKSRQVAQSLLSLGKACMDCDNYVAAEKAFAGAMKIDEDLTGVDSLEVAGDLSELARLHMDLGKYAQAETEYNKALAITEGKQGPQHPNTATCLNNLALLYRNQGKFTEAQKLLERGLTIRKSAFEPGNLQIAQNQLNLADVLNAQGKAAEAEVLLAAALAAQEDKLGAEHPAVSLTLRDLVDTLRTENKMQQAEGSARKLLTTDEKTYGADSAVVAGDLDVLAKIYLAQGKKDEAQPLKQRSFLIKSKLNGWQQPAIRIGGEAPKSVSSDDRPIKDKWALVVGISTFKDPSLNLKYAAKDATDFRNYLINDAGFKPDHIKLLTDEQATREGIVSNLGEKWLRRLANSDDLVVIYVSSHGTQAKKEASGTNFVVPHDANVSNIVFTGIPMQWLTAGLKDLVHCERVCLVLDVCHGGAVAQGQKGLTRTDAIDLSKITAGAGQLILASSQADQVSWESRRYPNSVFTRRLLEGLHVSGRKTTLNQAFNYMKDEIEEEVLRDRAELQTPVFMTQLWSGKDLSLAVDPVSPRPGIGGEPAITDKRK